MSTLRERMAQLRHCKLYKAGKKEVVRGQRVNRNPMGSNQLHDVARSNKPMTATATVMVKNVWQAYFRGAKPEGEGEEGGAEGEAAKVGGGVGWGGVLRLGSVLEGSRPARCAVVCRFPVLAILRRRMPCTLRHAPCRCRVLCPPAGGGGG